MEEQTRKRQGRPPKPLEERFKTKFKQGAPEECWIWEGGMSREGNGRIWDGVSVVPAHVVAYKLHTGKDIPPGFYCKHTCKKSGCVNPNHLEIKEKARKPNDPSPRGEENLTGTGDPAAQGSLLQPVQAGDN